MVGCGIRPPSSPIVSTLLIHSFVKVYHKQPRAQRGGTQELKKELAFPAYDHTRQPHIPATDIHWLLYYVPVACQNIGEGFLSS